ncbi:uncharacterized protein LOC113518997 [Galleria mellonella]|uniref:Uncharacterized protein LOC113518997 n=1 Tax=Galleria mellonella TaxID=7137 RepID=A0A6J1WV44_GALME|nr:uncharacterized protein LOC113518997 [Galleria mellonella]
MDASASPQVDADFDKVYGFFLKIENSTFPTAKQRNTVIKYTKLPEFEFDSKVSWPPNSYMSQPRLRRVVTVEDPDLKTSRSLKTDLMASSKMMASNFTKRKIVTITEDDENDLHPKFSKERRSSSTKISNRSVGTEFKEEKQFSQRTTSRLTSSSKYSKETKTNNVNNRKDISVAKLNCRGKYSSTNNQSTPENTRAKNVKGKEPTWKSRTAFTSSKVSLSKNIITPSESEREVCLLKSKLLENLKSNMSTKPVERTQINKSPPPSQNRRKNPVLKEIKNRNKAVTVIHVPLDEKYRKRDRVETSETIIHSTSDNIRQIDCSTEIDKIICSKDVNIGTDPLLTTVDQTTEIESHDFKMINKLIESDNFQEETKVFDSLEVPNVTLTKEKSESKEIVKLYNSKSLPNLQVPSLKITPNKDENNESNFYKSSSYIISRATVTCTTRQKINFHVVSSSSDTSNLSPSPIPLAYPMNVVSVYKKQMRKRELKDILQDDTYKKKDKTDIEYTDCINELKSLNCSYVFNNSKLVKPSDIISTIRVNNGLLQSDYICEQFQRELNFIDSFFESLQYLESCSLSNKCLSENKVESWVKNSGFDVRSPDYSSFLSKLENGNNVDETMASKSLCLLNLLIRDEQRRAKNLLFVLKMREDALKDYTKSQILWLEDKKKQDNTDISTLKKKQRGALLKLQHECGEMQRMRKALVALTEKRKVALMKTKKNIELKLSSSVDVDQILLGKKKLKRNTGSDRNIAPVKCFDLSSSGCEDTTTSRPKAETPLPVPESVTMVANVTSAEKSIQTGDSILATTPVDQSTETAAENFVVVDGSYLNILFHNLSLPQIFSYGKQYEVNEEALKNVVNSTNTNQSNLNETDVEKFIDQIKNPDLESSTPSTARSLVEEFDQYYKGLTEGEKSPLDLSEQDYNSSVMYELKDSLLQVTDLNLNQSENHNCQSASTMTGDSNETVRNTNIAVSTDKSCACESSVSPVEANAVMTNQTGPLPVPAGAAASMDSQPADMSLWLISKSSTSSVTTESSSISNQPPCASVSSVASLTSPVHHEAEELRRQQLAIEREIKALEQQQCQLLVVREIPDKPPPPYTPPTESRMTKIPRMFVADDTTAHRIQKYLTSLDTGPQDTTDAFDVFVHDFCYETLHRQKLEQSDKPWDSCNLLPQKPQADTEKLVKKTSLDLVEVLTGVTPAVVSGVASRRSDHIDDILFAEWRRCEPEWTALHVDEAIVKNQLFESIFQKILNETIDEYKRTVQCNK